MLIEWKIADVDPGTYDNLFGNCFRVEPRMDIISLANVFTPQESEPVPDR
jgi:hypothetical protein